MDPNDALHRSITTGGNRYNTILCNMHD